MLPQIRLWAAALALIAWSSLAAAAQERPTLAECLAAERDCALAFRDTPTIENRWTWIQALTQLGWSYADGGRDAEAVAPYRTALQTLPDGAESEEPNFVALLHDGLGRALQNRGDYVAAEPHLTTAYRMRSTQRGEDAEKNLGISEGHLGLLYLFRGRYTEAERLFRSALRHTPPDRDDLLAHRHDCFGRYYLSLRSHQLATRAYEKAIDHASIGARPDDPLLSDLRTNLALCRFREGDPASALLEVEGLLELHPAKELRRAELLNLSATILASLNRVEMAESQQEEAVEIITALKGPEHAATGTYLTNLGSIRLQAGDPRGALKPLELAEKRLRANLAHHHQALVETLYQIAICRLELGDQNDARDAVTKARAAADELMSTLIASGYERELLTFRQKVDLHSIVCRLGEADLIADSILSGKGRIMEAVLDSLTRFHQRSRHQAKLQAELDQLLLRGEEAPPPRVAELRNLIRELAVHAGAPDGPALSWQDVRKTLPADSAFIDCVRYLPGGDQAPRYGAVVILPKRDPLWVPLGKESAMSRLKLLHGSLETRAEILREGTGAANLPMVPLLTSLYKAFWEPLAEVLPENTREVILCPEGQAHLLPYAVLRNPAGSFLCEESFVLRLVDSGRSLVETRNPPASANAPWAILGMADFAPHRKRLAAGKHGLSPEWAEALADLGNLPTVRTEVATLRKLAPGASLVLLDRTARESALRALKAPPGILHLASHGLHVPLSGSGDFAADPSALYENGILLAPGDDDDGILFPEEIAALDLRGTRLATLSTCRSALGRPVGGEGLLGLRRGFAKAGAMNILASLWEIPDQSTATFMSAFYGALPRKSDPGALLWTMQATRFARLKDADPRGAKVETAILSYGGFLLTSPGGIQR